MNYSNRELLLFGLLLAGFFLPSNNWIMAWCLGVIVVVAWPWNDPTDPDAEYVD
jgi:hypothetical protein